ncbi:MAG TPA: acyl-CoA dehydrogenase family protein, partial [Dehalococcoidia bacterium]|nr:acyl-CoA dehydrogenase family protein [Dehalococcoidia bacterium]
SLQDLLGYCKDAGHDGANGSQPTVRHKLAELIIESDVGRYLSYRVASMQARGQVPNYEASVAKCYLSELSQRVACAGVNIMGLTGQLRPESKKWAKLQGQFAMTYMVTLG